MEENKILSIVVVTMNRAEQLKEALNSCLDCELPNKTEFVIIDNASTDNTKDIVDEFAKQSKYRVKYKYCESNLGVGGGRSLGFDLSSSEYLYFLDDDAIIAEECRKTFFTKPINIFTENPSIASITTRIYDELFGDFRTEGMENATKIAGCPIIYKYLGGSHFLRKSYFDSPLYFNIIYGSEEFAPSIKVQDKGYYNVFDKGNFIIHKPQINKWKDGTTIKVEILKKELAIPYATKRILYPIIFAPILKIGYMRRCKKHLKGCDCAIDESKEIAKKIIKENKQRKIRFCTVVKMYKEFGLTVF